jgi:hypothetical protein
MAHHLSVGQLYHPNRTIWPEGGEYNFDGAGHTLLLTWCHLDDKIIQAVRSGEVELALYGRREHPEEYPLVLLLYRIAGACDWSDAPYAWNFVPPERRTLPPAAATPSTRALLQVLLVDADTGILRAIRAVTMSPALTTLLHAAIQEQATGSWDLDAYDTALRRLQREHTPGSLAASPQAQLSRCRGGA